MNGLGQHEHAVISAVKDLEKKGYSVTVEPDPSIIPFDLDSYRPDILATREQDNLIIEIKTRGDKRSVERYKEIAEVIGSHENWHFMLSTVDIKDTNQIDHDFLEKKIDPNLIDKMIDRLDKLLISENYDLAIPSLWSLYISAMRLAGRKANIPIDLTSDQSVLNYMYSLGEISSEEYDWANHFLQLRNKAVHSLQITISRSELQNFYNHIKDKISEWNSVS